MRASKTGAGVTVLSVIPPDEFNHWIGVGEIFREEARERIEAHFEVFAKWMRSRPGVEPELVIREGDTAEELLAQITEDGEIGVVVLGLSSDKSSTNPVLTRLMRDPTALPCAISLVLGDLSKERLEAIT